MSDATPLGATPDPDLLTRIEASRAELLDRIARAGGDVGRGGLRIVAVTKTHPPEVAAAALAVGFDELGENYADEAVRKAIAVPDARWHFVGHLQTNKVRKLVGHVDCVQSVDRPSLVKELAKRMPDVSVLVEVNLSGEPQRSGVDVAGAPSLIEQARRAGLDVAGVMGVAPIGPDRVVAECFRGLRGLADAEGLAVVSMGMTADLEIAIAEGSTMIRVGSALFGERGT